MVFLHIDTKNYNVKNNVGEKPIDILNKFIINGKNVFMLIYMEGCGPCNATRPEWQKIKHVLKKEVNNNEILIVDIDKDLLENVKKIKIQPKGFPTIRFISNKGNISEDFEDSKLDEEYKNRNIDSFVKWIHLKLNENQNTNKYYNKSLKYNKTKRQKGGKWSLKYRRSINCKRPKGFSQKQYCKYTRKKH